MFFLYFFIFIFGLCIGSFLNAWIWRLHRDESMLGRRSYCPKCRKQLKNLDLIPLLSFLFLGGKCRSCKKKISWQYPLVEIATGMLYVAAFTAAVNHFGTATKGQVVLWLYWYCIAILIIVFVFDLKYYLILDKIIIPAIILVFLINLLLGAGFINLMFGAIIGAGFFWLQYKIPIWGREIFGKKSKLFKLDWVGAGDIRLGALIGFMVGWQGTLITLFISYISGAIVGIGLLATGKKKMHSKIPFGTFLSVGAVIALLWGQQILEWYQGLLRL